MLPILSPLLPPVWAQLTHLAGVAGAALPPNPAPQAPPGAQQLTEIVAEIKWVAGLALLGAFFGGLITFSIGRWADHHRAGRMGSTMILASLGGALLYGIGYTMITHFAGNQ